MVASGYSELLLHSRARGAWWPDSHRVRGAVRGGTSHCSKRDVRKSGTDFDEVLRVNPVSAINPHLRRALEREHKVGAGEVIVLLELLSNIGSTFPEIQWITQPLGNFCGVGESLCAVLSLNVARAAPDDGA